MALRILPFRQYVEQDVINLYALQGSDVNAQLDTRGNGDAGVFVKITNGDLTDGPIEYQTDSYLGKTDYPYVGRDQYPAVKLRIGVAGTGDNVLGLTLNQTALRDENGEKLLYYPQKALENQAVLSGQAVPVLSRGVIALSSTAAGAGGNNGYTNDSNWAVGNNVVIAEGAAGKLSGVNPVTARVAGPDGDIGRQVLGSILATGERDATNRQSDQFVGTSHGAYSIVKVDCRG
jgi:hypothetical protein